MSIEHPVNEQESIYHFIKRESEHGMKILNFYSAFPDASVADTRNEKIYTVEFEYKLSSFIKHGHNPFGCSFVVCWINDIPYVDFPLTVWELSTKSYFEIENPIIKELEEFRTLIDQKNFRKYDYRNRKAKPEDWDIFDGLTSIFWK